MSKLFFDRLIKLDTLRSQISQLNLAQEELQAIEDLIDQILQHKVMELILDKLADDQHQTFIAWIHTAPADEKLLTWLKAEIVDIEDHIAQAIQTTEAELLTEIISLK